MAGPTLLEIDATQQTLEITSSRDAVSIQGRAIETGTPTDGEVMTYSTSSSEWIYQTITENVDDRVAALIQDSAGGGLTWTYDDSAGTLTPAYVGDSTLVTSGALNSGSITSGFGTINIGSSALTAGAASFTTISGSTSLALATGATVTGIDNGGVATGSATLLATQGAIKTYVDAQVTAQDLDLITDSGNIDIDLDSESLTLAGGTGLDSSASSTTVTFAIDSTVATLAGSQTLTNKTLTTPVISSISNTGTVTLPTSTDTLVGKATTDTLTNKSISGSTNTLSAIANGSLTNSTVSYGGVSLALGASDATPAFDLSDATGYTGDSSLVTTGALNSGSITSGFTSIDVGSGAITTTGTVSATTLTGTLSTAAQTNITSVGALAAGSIASGFTSISTSYTDAKVESVVAGNLIDVSGATGDVTVSADLSELSTSTSDGDGDYFAVVDAANAQKKLTKANIDISGFNDAVATSITGTGALNAGSITSGFGAIDVGSSSIDGGTITGTFSGNLTGNVTGNTSGTAATVTGAAQSAITSVGTLTSLALSGDLDMADDDKILLGTGDDLQIYHDGSNSIISEGGPGGLLIYTAGVTTSGFYKVGGEALATFEPDGAVTLYYDNAVKLATVTGGATVTGTLTATTLAGTLSTAAQTAITSVGTLTGLTVSSLTSGRVVLAGTSGVLEDDAGMTYNTSTNTLTTDNFAGDFSVTNTTADASYYLTFVSASATGSRTLRADAGAYYNPSSNTLTADNLGGTLTTAAQSAITSVGTLTSLGVSGTGTVGGILSVDDTTETTSTTTGSVHTDGGVGIAKDLIVGGDMILGTNNVSELIGINTSGAEVSLLYLDNANNISIAGTGTHVAMGGTLAVTKTGSSSNWATTITNNYDGDSDVSVEIAFANSSGRNSGIGVSMDDANSGEYLLSLTSATANRFKISGDGVATFGGATNTFSTEAVIKDADGNGGLSITDNAGTPKVLQLWSTHGGSPSIGSRSNDSFQIITNDTVGLTVDTSQNATFVGSLNVGGGSNKFHRAVNSGNPQIHLGASDTEDMYIQAVYDGGTQNLNYIAFNSRTASGTANKGQFIFSVDEATVLSIQDAGIDVAGGVTASGDVVAPKVQVGGTAYSTCALSVLEDSASREIAYLQNSHATTPYGLFIDYSASSPNNAAYDFLRCEDSTAQRLNIWSNGNIVNQNDSYGAISDERLKTDMTPARSQWDDVKWLGANAINYRHLVDGDDANTLLGWGAQSVEAAGMGGLVELAGEDEDTYTLKTSVIHTKAVIALGEALVRIEALEAQLTG